MPRSSQDDRSLPANERIRKRAEYVRIQNSGRKIASPFFLAFVVGSSLPYPRLGVTVSRRVGKAVQRNRVKRLLREAFRQQKQHFPGRIEIVFVARADAARASFHQVFQEMEGICQRVARWF